jgi:hypothetical protein
MHGQAAGETAKERAREHEDPITDDEKIAAFVEQNVKLYDRPDSVEP